ncbi:hypothetical protein Tco_0196592 [Tanacetum coccineum]
MSCAPAAADMEDRSIYVCGCYHPNEPVHMMTARKRVGLLPTYHLTVRHSVDYSSSDLFTSDDSSRDSPSDSSTETSSDSSSDA